MPDDSELKMWIVLRQDIEMPLGKAMVQAAHAVQAATILALEYDDPTNLFYRGEARLKLYLEQNMPKITVKAKNLAAMDRAFKETFEAGIPASYIRDAGRTVFAEETPTVVGIGPCYYSELPRFVQRLQLL